MKEALLPIDEVAVRSGLASSALRYYERCGLLRSGEKIGGRRHYPPSVLQRLSTIKVCQTLGFSLAEIAELLEGPRDGAVWQKLSRIRRAELRSQIQELQSLLEILDTTVDCGCPTLHDCPEMSPEGRLAQAVPERPHKSARPVVRTAAAHVPAHTPARSARPTTHASAHGPSHGSSHGASHGSGHAPSHGSGHAPSHGSGHGSNHGASHGSNHAPARPAGHSTPRPSTHPAGHSATS